MPRPPQCAAEGDFKRLHRGKLVSDALNLLFKARGNMSQHWVSSNCGLGSSEPLQLAFEGLDGLGANKCWKSGPRDGI